MQRKDASLAAYFSQSSALSEADLSTVSEALMEINGRITAQIGGRKKIRPRPPIDNSVSVLEAKHRLTRFRQEQETLVSRLAYVSSQMAELQQQGVQPPAKKRRIKSVSMDLGQACREEDRQLESVAERIAVVRRLHREKQERHRRMQSQEALRQKLEAEKEAEQAALAAEEQARQKGEMLEAIQRRHAATLQRQAERFRLKSDSDRRLAVAKSQSRLYKLWEAEFQRKFVDPEKRRIEEVLVRKRRSESFGDVQQHAWEVKERVEQLTRMKGEQRAKRQQELLEWQKSTKFFHGKLPELQRAEEMAAKLASLQKEESARRLYTKKLQYGEVIRALFKPSPSSLKKLESELSRSKAAPRKPVSQTPQPVLRSPPRRKHVAKVQQTASEPEIHRPKNYLQDLKQQRTAVASAEQEHWHGRWKSLIEAGDKTRWPEILRHSQKLDTLARSHEFGIGAEDWSASLSHREAVSSLYLASIRAKLCFLSKLSA